MLYCKYLGTRMHYAVPYPAISGPSAYNLWSPMTLTFKKIEIA